MTARTNHRPGPILFIFLMLLLLAPLAPAAHAQDDAAPADAPADAAAPATEDDPTPPPEPADPPASADEPAPVETEPPPAEDAPGEPAPAPTEPPVEPTLTPSETPVPTTAPTVAATGSSETEPAEPDVDNALAVESTLTVSVVDALTTAPIAGAAVVVFDESWTQVASVTNDASGIAAVGALAEGWYHLEAAADGYHSGQWYYQWVSGPTELSLALQPLPSAGALSVRVVDQQTSAPIAGATVTVREYWTGVDVTTGTTAEDGTFVTPDLPGGEYGVSVSTAQYLDGSFYAQVNGPTELTAPLQLAPLPGNLSLHVVDQQSGDPIAGATVLVYDVTGSQAAGGTTDANGAFVAGELPGGWYRIDVSADAYLGISEYVEIDGAAEHTFALQLAPLPGTLEVTVIDAVTGEPVAGATVSITWPIFLSGMSDATGVFITPELASGNYWVEVSAPGYEGALAFVAVDGPVERTFALQLAPLPGTLEVTVVDAVTESPVAGALVTAIGTNFSSGTTDDTGVFVTPELASGNYLIQVSATGYLGGTATVTIDGPAETTIRLEPTHPGTLTVTVVDAITGEPIAGTDVSVTWPTSVSGTTDAAGVFITPELASGNYQLEARAYGYHTGFTYIWVNGPTEFTFQLAPLQAGTLTVLAVEESTWTPIAGANVVVRHGATGAEVAVGVTDAAGAFISAELPGGTYDIDVTAEGYFPVSGSATVNGPVFAWLQMQPQIAGVLTVNVVDAPTGETLAGASVTVTDPDGNEVAAGATGENGAFSTGTLEGGWYDIAVTATGFEPATTRAFVSGDSSVSAWLAPPSGTLTVVVTDRISGQPVAGATVMVSNFASIVATGSTDANGTFTTGVLDPVQYYIDVSAEGYFRTDDTSIVRGDTVLAIALAPHVDGPLTVLVTDHLTGEPIHKASVVVDGPSMGGSATGITNSKGAFVTDTLPSDWYRVEVRADGYDPDSGVRHVLVSGPTEITVTLEPQPPGTLTITAVDQVSGEPVADAVVEVRDYDTWMIVDSGKTKKGGVFTTKELPAGHYNIQVEADGYFLNGDSRWVSGDTAITMWLYPATPGTLTVTALDQVTGAPIASAEVVVRNPSNGAEVVTGKTEVNGVFVTGMIEAGDYILDVTADGYLPHRNGYIGVNGDVETTRSLEPAVPGALTVSVMDQSTWQPLPGATVTVRDSWTGAVVATDVTDASGYLIIPDMPGGDYAVEAAAEGYVLTGFASIRISGPASVTLWMAPGEPGTLTVSVFDDRTGTPIAGATVVVRDGSGVEFATGTTDSEGSFTTSELPTGNYYMDVTADRYHPSGNQFAVVNGQRSVWVGLTLRTEATLSVSVDVGTPGMKLSVEGSGFQPGETVTIAWQDPDGTVLATTKAKSDGTIATSFTVPDTYPSWYRVLAVGQDSDVIGAASITVIVPMTP